MGTCDRCKATEPTHWVAEQGWLCLRCCATLLGRAYTGLALLNEQLPKWRAQPQNGAWKFIPKTTAVHIHVEEE